jgi:hypothetical protein
MAALLRIPLVLLLSLGACAVDQAPESSDERADSNEVIDYRRPEAPTIIEFDESGSATTAQSLAFGHCDEAETGDDGSIDISCPQKWSELAWLSIPRRSTEALMAEGKTHLNFDLAILGATIEGESVRFGLRSVDEEGNKTKVLTENNLFDGSSVELELAASEYEIFIARAANQFLSWPNSAIEIELATTAE